MAVPIFLEKIELDTDLMIRLGQKTKRKEILLTVCHDIWYDTPSYNGGKAAIHIATHKKNHVTSTLKYEKNDIGIRYLQK